MVGQLWLVQCGKLVGKVWWLGAEIWELRQYGRRTVDQLVLYFLKQIIGRPLWICLDLPVLSQYSSRKTLWRGAKKVIRAMEDLAQGTIVISSSQSRWLLFRWPRFQKP